MSNGQLESGVKQCCDTMQVPPDSFYKRNRATTFPFPRSGRSRPRSPSFPPTLTSQPPPPYPPPCGAAAPRPSRRLCAGQSASACAKEPKSPPLVARPVQDGCGVSEREGRLPCASNVLFFTQVRTALAGAIEERSGVKGPAYPGLVLWRLGSVGEHQRSTACV